MSSYEFVFDGETVTSEVEKKEPNLTIRVGEKELVLIPIGQNLYTTTWNGTKHTVAVVRHKDTYYVDIDSVLLEVHEVSEDSFGAGAGEHGGEKDKIFAPMPGKIVKIMVNEGDEVEVKQPMVIVEAMKMENQVNSPAKGKVKKINFAPGDQVDTESPIIELELAE